MAALDESDRDRFMAEWGSSSLVLPDPDTDVDFDKELSEVYHQIFPPYRQSYDAYNSAIERAENKVKLNEKLCLVDDLILFLEKLFLK